MRSGMSSGMSIGMISGMISSMNSVMSSGISSANFLNHKLAIGNPYCSLVRTTAVFVTLLSLYDVGDLCDDNDIVSFMSEFCIKTFTRWRFMTKC